MRIRFDDPDFANKSLEQDLKYARRPLKTIKDCFFTVDVMEDASFAAIQRSYRARLFDFNLSRISPVHPRYEYNSLMLEKVKEAYLKICKLKNQDPHKGLEETVESLAAERDSLIESWKGHWCGTPQVLIKEDYDERIRLLKNKLARQ
jgi:hypothetical protein